VFDSKHNVKKPHRLVTKGSLIKLSQ